MSSVELANRIDLMNLGLKKEINNLNDESTKCASFTIIEDILNSLIDVKVSRDLLKASLIGKTVTKAKMKLGGAIRVSWGDCFP